MVRFNRKLFELGMASYNDPSNTAYEEEAKRVIAEFKARINAAVNTENNEFVSIIRLVEEYQETLNKAKSFCHPSTKNQLIQFLERLNQLYHEIHRLSSFLNYKALGGTIY